MANRGYLCVSAFDGLYPSAHEGGYDPDCQTAAASAYCLPGVWLAGFAPHDVVRRELAATVHLAAGMLGT